MSIADDRKTTPKERFEINKRRMEISIQKKNQANTLSELKKEVGLPDKGRRK